MASKKTIILVLIVILAVAFYFWNKSVTKKVETEVQKEVVNVEVEKVPVKTVAPLTTTLATGLSIPWDIAFMPDDSFLVTERAGNLVQIKGNDKTSIKLPRAVPRGEGGLLGIVPHPRFTENNFLYLYMTTGSAETGTKNAVFRYKFINGVLSDEKIIIKDIPGAIYHDGGRMEFGLDGLLYITTGDATNENIAQDLKSLGGKILRVNEDGTIPADNPFGTAIYSYGHRNPQGLAWDSEGRLWETEHGRSGVTSGMDELNLIIKGANYGWPVIEGDQTKEKMISPERHSGADITWAPASLVFYKGSLYFGGLKGEALYEAVMDGTTVKDFKTYFKGKFGRIRTVRLGPDDMLYITTSNKDGRGDSVAEDDRLIRINPELL